VTDILIWFWGTDFSAGLTDEETRWLKGWNESFVAFIKGKAAEW